MLVGRALLVVAGARLSVNVALLVVSRVLLFVPSYRICRAWSLFIKLLFFLGFWWVVLFPVWVLWFE